MWPRVRRTPLKLIALAILLSAGCGGSNSYDRAPVSGQVTLDGQPLAGALVTFQPAAEGSAINPGPGSLGRTDDQGRYELETVVGTRGAVVGSHRVRITSVQEDDTPTSEDDPPGQPAKERLPRRYNADSELVFDVPPSGTSSADFALSSADAP